MTCSYSRLRPLLQVYDLHSTISSPDQDLPAVVLTSRTINKQGPTAALNVVGFHHLAFVNIVNLNLLFSQYHKLSWGKTCNSHWWCWHLHFKYALAFWVQQSVIKLKWVWGDTSKLWRARACKIHNTHLPQLKDRLVSKSVVKEKTHKGPFLVQQIHPLAYRLKLDNFNHTRANDAIVAFDCVKAAHFNLSLSAEQVNRQRRVALDGINLAEIYLRQWFARSQIFVNVLNVLLTSLYQFLAVVEFSRDE